MFPYSSYLLIETEEKNLNEFRNGNKNWVKINADSIKTVPDEASVVIRLEKNRIREDC